MKPGFIRVALTAVVAVVGLGLGTGARAQDQDQEKMRSQMEEQAGKAQMQNLRILGLTVKKVDPKQHKVTFEAKISPEASYTTTTGEPIRIDQLKEGDQVRAAFDPATGQVMEVQVLPAKKK
jgi:Cu/Ag efflux protein CusF